MFFQSGQFLFDGGCLVILKRFLAVLSGQFTKGVGFSFRQFNLFEQSVESVKCRAPTVRRRAAEKLSSCLRGLLSRDESDELSLRLGQLGSYSFELSALLRLTRL